MSGAAFRIALYAFPRRFREAHAGDLADLYRDYASAGRPMGRREALWDLISNGLRLRLGRTAHHARASLQPPPRLPSGRSHRMDSLWQDLRFGARMLRKSPAFTAVAIISLAVGIGANTAVFGFVDAALLRPLAVPDPDELVVLGWRSPAGTEMPDISIWGWYQRDDNEDGLSSSYSLPAFEALRDRNDVLTATFAFADMSDVNLTYDEQSELAATQVVSGNYHGALGIEPALGRLIVPDDNRADAGAVAVLSHGYWQRRFGGDEGMVGRTVRLNGTPFTIIGVTPPAFRGTLQVGDNPDVSVPLVHQPLVSTSTRDMTQPGFWWLHVMGRLAPGVSRETAGEQLNAILHQSVEGDLFPEGVPPEYTLPNVDLRPGFQGMTEQRNQLETPLRIMAAVVALVLLIACINVANLLMARAATRRREIAVRRSIGAARWRIVRQMLAESVVLSGVAGLIGVALAVWGREVLVRALSTRDLYVEGVRTDARVLGFGLLASLLTGLLFGLVPALRASRPDLTPALKEGAGDHARSDGGRLPGGAWPDFARRGFVRHRGAWGLRTLLTTQVALSMLLLVVAGLFVRTLVNLEREATGFDARGVALLRINPGLNGYEGERRVALHEELQRRMRGIPGVIATTVTSHSPVSGRISYTTLKLPGYEPAEGENPGAFYNLVTPGFFETFEIPVLLGRGIEDRDRDGAPMVTVVNETFVERYLAGENPIGRRLGLGREGDPSEYEIVGVAADVKYQQLSDEQYPVAHVALRQHVDDSSSLTLALRAGGVPTGDVAAPLLGAGGGSARAAGSLIAAARDVVRQVDPGIPVFDARTLEQQQATTLEMERLFARMALVLGGLALGLASIGLYGVLSYNVARRTREIGVRRALGARAADVLRVVLGEIGAVLLGVVLGLGLAIAATGYLESQLYGLSADDRGTYGAATGVLLAVAALAAWVPARRASSVDPAIALRAD